MYYDVEGNEVTDFASSVQKNPYEGSLKSYNGLKQSHKNFQKMGDKFIPSRFRDNIAGVGNSMVNKFTNSLNNLRNNSIKEQSTIGYINQNATQNITDISNAARLAAIAAAERKVRRYAWANSADGKNLKMLADNFGSNYQQVYDEKYNSIL